MRDDVNATIDPFAGLCGASGTVWKHQWQANADFKIVQVASLSAPLAFAACDTSSFTYPGSDTPNFQDSFSPGQQVLATAFLRDQPVGSSVHVQVFNPSGTAVLDAHTSGASRFFSASQ